MDVLVSSHLKFLPRDSIVQGTIKFQGIRLSHRNGSNYTCSSSDFGESVPTARYYATGSCSAWVGYEEAPHSP